MLPVSGSARSDATIRQIHREVTANRRVLEEKEAEAREAEAAIPNLESRVSALRAQIAEVDAESGEFAQQFARQQRACDGIQEQTRRLRELGAVFQARERDSGASDAAELPPDVRARVLSKIGEVIDTVREEYSEFDASEFDNFFNESDQLEAEIDREIELLSQMEADDWVPRDELQDGLAEFCSHFGPPPTASQLTLSTVAVPHATAPLEIFERHFACEVPPPSLEKLRAEYDCLNSLLTARQNREAGIYREQRRFLKGLKPYLLQYEAAFDADAISRELGEQTRRLPEPDLIVPLRIPTDDEPLAAFSSEIGHFIEELERSRRSALLLSELEKSADEVVRVPEVTVPPPPTYVKNSIPSPQLVELADRLQQIGEAVRQLIPVSAFQSLTNSYRRSLSEEPPPQSAIQVSDAIELDPQRLIQFRQTVASKLPPVIARRLESCDFSGPRIEYEEVEDDLELKVDRELEERSTALNSLLKSMAAIQLPAIPTFPEPSAGDLPSGPLDSSPLLKAIGKLLSSDQQTASALKVEISDLEQRVAAALEEVAGRETEQQAAERELRELSDQIAAKEEALSVTSGKVARKSEKIRQLRKERSEAQEKQAAMEEEINAAANIDDVIAMKKAELGNMREELAQSKKIAEDEEELRRQLLEGMMRD
jgi:septal ring factor EnvC (AmiA/AmiB activator)